MNIILAIFYTLILLFLIYKFRFFKIEGISFKIVSGIFLLKILSGFVLILIYTFYYPHENGKADVFNYYEDGQIILSSLKDNPIDYLRMVTGIGSDAEHLKDLYLSKTQFWYKEWDYHLYNDNRTVIRFNALALLFSNGSIYINSIFMSFLSFIGLLSIFKIFEPYFPTKKWFLLISVFLLPSVMLWSSGILKEGILTFAMGIMLLGFFRMLENFKFKYFTFFALGILLFSFTKFYALIALIPGMIALFWLQKTNHKNPFLKFTIVHVVLFFLATRSQYLKFVIYLKQTDFKVLIKGTDAGSLISSPVLEPTTWSLIKNAPWAFANTLFRPFLLDVYSPLVLFAAAENFLIILMFILSISFFNKKLISNYSLLYFSIFFVIIMFVLCGLVTPVMGALVRYKIPALPFLFVIFLFVTDFEKIKTFYNKIFQQKTTQEKL